MIKQLDWWQRLWKAEPAVASEPVAHAVLPPAPDCLVIDDEEGIRTFIATVAERAGLTAEQHASTATLGEGTAQAKVVFLDISLGGSDAVAGIRDLSRVGFRGALQIISGQPKELVQDVLKVAQRHRLTLLPPLAKPIGTKHVRSTLARCGLMETAGSTLVDLGEALRSGWLEVWYQPKVDLKSKLLVGAEALARLRHPEMGVLFPRSFLPGASDAVLAELSIRMIETVLEDWPSFEAERALLTPSVNVPFSALAALPVAAIIHRLKPRSERWPGILLEVTEDQAIRDVGLAHEVATQLRIHNIRLSLDDFGAGYSSLARLKQLPFAELKLDRSYVKNCACDPVHHAICKAAIDLAHSFGSVAVAEGIENVEDFKALRALGCDLGQGFLLSPPMPKHELIELVRRRGVERLEENQQNAELAVRIPYSGQQHSLAPALGFAALPPAEQ